MARLPDHGSLTVIVGLVALTVAGALVVRSSVPASERPANAATASAPVPARSEEVVEAAPPPFSEGIFPCSQCHEGAGDDTRRQLAFHEEIQARLAHGPNWCLGCHDLAQRDVIHLSNGERIPFTESYRLCGQCHYDKYRDWRLGIHGKRVGRWDGAKTTLLCVSCHDPHAPRFASLKPEPRPPTAKETRR